MSYLDDTEFALNPDPRCPCVLLLDTSSSMNGEPVTALNQGLQSFQVDIRQDALAQRRVEIAIVSFGNGGVKTLQDFVTANQFEAPTLSAAGNTPMGEAINRALDMLRERKGQYKENAIPYYRPWLFMITDGAPTDAWQDAAQRIRDEEGAKQLAFFAVGVGQADLATLAKIAVRKPIMLQGLKFNELFLWLSRSQKRVSASKVGEQTPLPSIEDWSVV
jgi:uncharacterized protein YegL